MLRGEVEDVSSLTHQAEVCSLDNYKTLIKGGGGRGGQGWGQVVRGALGGGGARGKSKLEEKQKPCKRVTGVGCGGREG